MQSIVIDLTELRVSRWSFGTGSLHHLPLASKRDRLLNSAADMGFTHFDTSPYYGYGLAEYDLGRFLRSRRSSFTVATKVGLYPYGPASAGAFSVWGRKAIGRLVPKISAPRVDWTVRRAKLSLDQSLIRLQTDYVDVLFLHEPDPAVVVADEFLGWLESERRHGRVRHFGLAGSTDPMLPWIGDRHGLGQVLQVRDTLDRRQAEPIVEIGRELQFTYGYLSGHKTCFDQDSVQNYLRAVLARNRRGSVIVSTRRCERLRNFAKAVEG